MKITDKISPEEYRKYINRTIPKSNVLLDCLKAFLVGGIICTIGQGVLYLATDVMQLSEEAAGNFTCVVMIFLGALLTGLGVYDIIGKFAGAGSIVPITGFANSVVSPAMEWKREGYILGVGAKMFTVAGPVIVYGVCASVVYGFIYWLCTLL